MCAELVQAMQHLADDPDAHVVLIAAAGAAFCAGADLKERKTMSNAEMTARRVQGFAAYAAIERMPQPVIAVVQGAAFGSGCEIAAASDFVLASSEATFCYPEVGWGTVGATQRLPRVAGARKAKELLFTGRRFDAAEAREIGLVNQVYAPEALAGEAAQMAAAVSYTHLDVYKRQGVFFEQVAGQMRECFAHRAVQLGASLVRRVVVHREPVQREQFVE